MKTRVPKNNNKKITEKRKNSRAHEFSRKSLKRGIKLIREKTLCSLEEPENSETARRYLSLPSPVCHFRARVTQAWVMSRHSAVHLLAKGFDISINKSITETISFRKSKSITTLNSLSLSKRHEAFLWDNFI
ncbi:hypothetical protein CEXT_130731 [Caerostris extrusa]|uniref:Uncharacterized protein n=1 Tax=Caerostris extrusa TaxID=172846 RepID=A0AAV4VFJ0_CAEEX|nr:hypothetical protein CEXT_130731 [Caerostris extrusa]